MTDTVKRFEWSTSVSVNGNAAATYNKSLSSLISSKGYTYVFPQVLTTGNDHLLVLQCFFSSGNMTVRLRNVYSATQTGTMSCGVLAVKTQSYGDTENI